MGSFLVTLLLGIAFGRGILFEVMPQTTALVLRAKISEKVRSDENESVHIEANNSSELPPVETPLPGDTLGAITEFLTPPPTETEVPIETVTPTLTITASPKPTLTITMTPTATMTPTLLPSVTNTQTPTVTPSVPVPQVTVPANLEPLFTQYSNQYGVDVNLLKKIAKCESNFNNNASGAGGAYVGMFQFAAGSWQTVRKQMGADPNPNLRYGANESIETAAFALAHGRASMWPNCR